MSGVRPVGNSYLLGIFLHSALDDLGLDPYEFRVYAHLCRRANDEQRVWEGQKKMAAICKISERRVRDSLKTLEERGLIRQDMQFREDGSQTTNLILMIGPFNSAPPPRQDMPPPPASRAAPPGTTCRAKGNPLEGNPEKKIGSKKTRKADPHFDAIVAALYPQGDNLSNAGHVAKVANALKAAEWTPEDITSVLSAIRRDKFWKDALTLGSFEKNAEDWRRRYGRARKEELRPPVVPPAATDDLDWTAME